MQDKEEEEDEQDKNRKCGKQTLKLSRYHLCFAFWEIPGLIPVREFNYPDWGSLCLLFFSRSNRILALYLTQATTILVYVIRRTFLEDIWGGARRGLLRSSSLSQEGGGVQLALRGT
jgi:hypothetical protein